MDLQNEYSQKKVFAAEMAYTAIRKSIINGELRPGYPVLESEFSERLGISRTPIREAINRLKAEDLIERLPRKGIFVKALSMEDLYKKYEVAEGLEGMVAYLVALDPAGNLAKLQNSIIGMENALCLEDTEQWIEADERYHAALLNLCKNEHLVDHLRRLNEKLHLARLLLIARSAPDKNQSTMEHKAAFEAIKARDATLARTITQNHWKRVRSSYRSLV
ncbi:GntR family transcriptional regulator [Neobacillus sp. SuZ13]|uniref:GntR family transcriptional regulator n=1 Tax=Neobacillus sp. SuZ13 TaxID=3047875 RepID=UPI0024BF2D3C|nr:GntR family transcriptional regulator [Neobacillus sp. SuZ13]WHY66529.1 GntR family transcriptional regulator [Neobacillus sp. SuZ13]